MPSAGGTLPSPSKPVSPCCWSVACRKRSVCIPRYQYVFPLPSDNILISLTSCVPVPFQGLFRVAPSASKLKKLKASLDCGVMDVQEYSADPHSIAGELATKPPPKISHFLSLCTVLSCQLTLSWRSSRNLPLVYSGYQGLPVNLRTST